MNESLAILKKWGSLFIIPAVVIVDLYTKALIQRDFFLYQSVKVIDGFLNITYVENPGAAFGIMSDMNPEIRSVFFVIISLVAIATVIYIYIKHPDNNLIKNASTLILGGAIGNMIDRIRFGAVVDFIDVYFRGYHWPAFNVADTAISVGVGLFLLDAFRKTSTDAHQSSADKHLSGESQ